VARGQETYQQEADTTAPLTGLLPAPEFRKTLPANREQIADHTEGKHAVPGGFESNLSEMASDLRQQLAMSRRPEVCRG